MMRRAAVRADAEDLSVQEARVQDARARLKRALKDLGEATKKAGTLRAPLDDVHGAYGRVARAEEDLDIANHDLATASGEHA